MTPTTSSPLRILRIASLIEGATLLVLLLIAVPLKRWADWPLAVSFMGPLHGAAFVIYSLLVLQALLARWINVSVATRLMGAAFIPFGALMVAGLLRRHQSLRPLESADS